MCTFPDAVNPQTQSDPQQLCTGNHHPWEPKIINSNIRTIHATILVTNLSTNPIYDACYESCYESIDYVDGSMPLTQAKKSMMHAMNHVMNTSTNPLTVLIAEISNIPSSVCSFVSREQL